MLEGAAAMSFHHAVGGAAMSFHHAVGGAAALGMLRATCMNAALRLEMSTCHVDVSTCHADVSTCHVAPVGALKGYRLKC